MVFYPSTLWFSGKDWHYTTGFLGSPTCRQQLWDFSATIKSHKPIPHNKSCFIHAYVPVCVQWLQLCPTLCSPVDFSPPGSSVHGILQAGILEWVAMPSSRGSSRPREDLNSGLLHCRWILNPLSYLESPCMNCNSTQ